MKPLKIQLLILFLIPCVSSISAQEKPKIIVSLPSFFTPCDTIYLKNGTSKLVKLGKTEKGYLHYYECNEDRNHPDDMLRLVEENDINYVREGVIQKTYSNIVELNPKFYCEAAANYSLIGYGGSAFLGYKPKPNFGFGISYMNHLSAPYTVYIIQSLNLDIRRDIGKNIFSFHAGIILKKPYNATEYCKNVELNKSKLPMAYGVSWRRYTIYHIFYGIHTGFSSIPLTRSCTNNQANSVYKEEKKVLEIPTIRLFLGIYLSKKYAKRKRD
jgi:hypothetical protein